MIAENLFLIILALIYIAAASIFDLRKREVPNWLNFSLIAFALAYRAFFSVLNSDLMFFVYGLIGLGVFVALGYIFYYGRVFAGGDAKLLMALGAVLPLNSVVDSLLVFIVFIFLLLLCGSVYGLIWSFVLTVRNIKSFSSEFKKQLRKNRKIWRYSFVLSALSLLLPLILQELILLVIPLIFFLFPVLFVYAKSVEESSMIFRVPSSRLTEGDWLYEKVRVGKKTIKPYWEGLSIQEIRLIRKYKKSVKIKQGIPFVPAFFFAFLFLMLFWNYFLILIFAF
jgi:Flp pilus assembly protein protease CpaA